MRICPSQLLATCIVLILDIIALIPEGKIFFKCRLWSPCSQFRIELKFKVQHVFQVIQENSGIVPLRPTVEIQAILGKDNENKLNKLCIGRPASSKDSLEYGSEDKQRDFLTCTKRCHQLVSLLEILGHSRHLWTSRPPELCRSMTSRKFVQMYRRKQVNACEVDGAERNRETLSTYSWSYVKYQAHSIYFRISGSIGRL